MTPTTCASHTLLSAAPNAQRRVPRTLLLLAGLLLLGAAACGGSTAEPTCDDLPIPDPPPDRCADDETAVLFSAEPECLDGRWIYTGENIDCGAQGERCLDAQCLPTDCSGEECAEPGDPCSSDFDCPVERRVFAECRDDEVYAYADRLVCDRDEGVCVPDEVVENCRAEGNVCEVAEFGCYCETNCSMAGSDSAYMSCEGNTAVSTFPVVVDCRCENPRQETDCAEQDQVCSFGMCVDPPERNCGGVDCTELEEPEPVCDGSEVLRSAGYRCDTEAEGGPVCEPIVVDREDCALDGEICVEGACIDADLDCGGIDCTALDLPGPRCVDDTVRTPERWFCDLGGDEPACEVEESTEDCTAVDEICDAEAPACVEPPGSGNGNGEGNGEGEGEGDGNGGGEGEGEGD